jgi:hypothetical protein
VVGAGPAKIRSRPHDSSRPWFLDFFPKKRAKGFLFTINLHTFAHRNNVLTTNISNYYA